MKVKPFSCWQCDKSFDQSSHLLTNVKVHSGREPYRCYPCTKSFAQSSNLKTRLKIHTGEKPYMCSMCAKSSVMCLAATFKSSHLWEILLLFTVYKVVCTVVCPAAHLKIHSEKVFRCSQCTESFSLSGALLKRSKIHTGENLDGSVPFALRSHYLQVHVRFHSSEKPFSCSHCTKSLALSADLKNIWVYISEKL